MKMKKISKKKKIKVYRKSAFEFICEILLNCFLWYACVKRVSEGLLDVSDMFPWILIPLFPLLLIRHARQFIAVDLNSEALTFSGQGFKKTTIPLHNLARIAIISKKGVGEIPAIETKDGTVYELDGWDNSDAHGYEVNAAVRRYESFIDKVNKILEERY